MNAPTTIEAKKAVSRIKEEITTIIKNFEEKTPNVVINNIEVRRLEMNIATRGTVDVGFTIHIEARITDKVNIIPRKEQQ